MAENSTNIPIVSVVLPFFNAPHLSEAVTSILNQSFQDFELILVNNASTDSSVQVAAAFEEHPQVSVVEEEQRGVVHAANAGIRAAKGAFIARMDADDIALPERLQLQFDYLQKHAEVAAVSGRVAYLGNEGNNKGFVHYIEWLNSVVSEKQIANSRFIEFPVVNPSLMFRKSVFDQIGYYEDGDFPEDYEFFLRMLDQRLRIAKIPATVLQWRDSAQRLTRTDPRYSNSSFYDIKAKYLALWLTRNNPLHPKVWIWGAGRLSRRRSELLKEKGVRIERYIDFEASEQVISYRDLPGPGSQFIISYVGNRGARNKIRAYLVDRDYVEGLHFILAS